MTEEKQLYDHIIEERNHKLSTTVLRFLPKDQNYFKNKYDKEVAEYVVSLQFHEFVSIILFLPKTDYFFPINPCPTSESIERL